MKTLLILPFVIISFACKAQKVDCVTTESSGPMGESYGPNNLAVTIKNRCTEAMYVRICIQKHLDGKIIWFCQDFTAAPREVAFRVCSEAPGKYKVFSRANNDYNTKFPDPKTMSLSDTDN